MWYFTKLSTKSKFNPEEEQVWDHIYWDPDEMCCYYYQLNDFKVLKTKPPNAKKIMGSWDIPVNDFTISSLWGKLTSKLVMNGNAEIVNDYERGGFFLIGVK